MELPNEELRGSLFRHFLDQQGIRCEGEVIDELVRRSRGMSGAHIREVVTTAAIEALEEGRGKTGEEPWGVERFLRAAQRLETVRPLVGFKTA